MKQVAKSDILNHTSWVSYTLPLPPRLKIEGWKVKIRNWERVETPHATILRYTQEWRFDLRTGDFLEPPKANKNDIPKDLWIVLRNNLDLLTREWDARYPENPVGGNEEANE